MLLEEVFVQAKLATEFGEFYIRVYPDAKNEPFILWKDNVNVAKPTLVRVHSECVTGDTLRGLNCDCGNQLTRALEQIGREGGVLIYLRQEGRGIGLFEKIKSYEIQSQGHDTFQANVLLGHLPDERSYELVKTMLDDLGISKIRLLTNNPSKISDIAKLGIEITERVPLISEPNIYNQAYLDTKKQKFHHLLEASSHHYFYQFHVNIPEEVDEIGAFLKDKKRDPLCKVCVGITVTTVYLEDPEEIARVDAIAERCKEYLDFIPVLHVSFLHTSDLLQEVTKVRKNWANIDRLQLNDLGKIDLPILEEIASQFTIDIPLCDDTFSIVHDEAFRRFIRKTQSFVMLDNSKGRGIKESKQSLMKKIDTLLEYGLNDIVLCGGFGPDQLDIYFEIRRYYRINFSIDAETNLKTEGKIDLSKVKRYLFQLFRFDDPHQEGIAQTKKFLEKHRRFDWDRITFKNQEFLVHPKVFHPGYFPSSLWFATELATLVKQREHFCEIGCGSGIISCLLAKENPGLKVTATDLNPDAAENTKLNVERLGLTGVVKVYIGDVFDGIALSSLFDTIFWALPFGFLDPGKEIALEESQVFDPGYRAIRKFFETSKIHLAPQGKILIGFSPDLGHPTLLKELVEECRLKMKVLREKMMKEESEIRFQIIECIPF